MSFYPDCSDSFLKVAKLSEIAPILPRIASYTLSDFMASVFLLIAVISSSRAPKRSSLLSSSVPSAVEPPALVTL